MAVTMLNPNSRNQSLEDCIRTALEIGELPPVLNQQIQSLTRGYLSEREQKLLQLLEDAIQDGCIQVTNDSSVSRDVSRD